MHTYFNNFPYLQWKYMIRGIGDTYEISKYNQSIYMFQEYIS